MRAQNGQWKNEGGREAAISKFHIQLNIYQFTLLVMIFSLRPLAIDMKLSVRLIWLDTVMFIQRVLVTNSGVSIRSLQFYIFILHFVVVFL